MVCPTGTFQCHKNCKVASIFYLAKIKLYWSQHQLTSSALNPANLNDIIIKIIFATLPTLHFAWNLSRHIFLCKYKVKKSLLNIKLLKFWEPLSSPSSCVVVVCKKIIRYQPLLLHTATGDGGGGAAGVRLHCPPVVCVAAGLQAHRHVVIPGAQPGLVRHTAPPWTGKLKNYIPVQK